MRLTDTMRAALRDSVQAEQAAHDFYKAAAEKVTNVSLRDMFEKLAIDELGHRDFLQGLLAGDAFDVTIKEAANDYRLAEETIEEKPELTTDMPFDKAIAMAIKREEEAMASYEALAKEAEGDEQLHSMFINLRNMEQSHKTSLEAIYMNVAYAEVW